MARDLDGAIRGAVVRSVRVLRADVLRGPSASAFARQLAASRIAKVWRRGKNVIVDLQRVSDSTRGVAAARRGTRHLAISPRFTGSLLIDAVPDAYTCVTFVLVDGRQLAYRDVRRLGTLTLFDTDTFASWEAALGPEPLDPPLTAERFSGILRGSSAAVKSILMDQRKVAGVGNIYANEACWRAGVRPSRRGRSLTTREAAALTESVVAVLAESVARRGTSFRDFRDAYGKRGGFAPHLAVYGRGGEACLRCGATLKESHAIARRTTVWCPSCQR